MKICIERKDGRLYVKYVVKQNSPGRPDPFRLMRTIKTVKDTPANFADVLRWADAMGREVEEL